MNRRFFIQTLALGTTLAIASSTAGPLTAHAAPAQSATRPVQLFESPQLVPNAWSVLVRTDYGVAVTLHTAGLAAGHAVSLVMAVFNNPQACASGVLGFRCGPADLGNAAAEPSLILGPGHVVGASGVTDFGSGLVAGDTSSAIFGPGLLNPRGADIHLVVYDHGSAMSGVTGDLIHSFNACNPTCTFSQMSIQQAS
jgi:hypothetical protein